MVTVEPELQAVFVVVMPLVAPVVQLALSVAGTATGAVVPQILSMVADIEGVVSTTLSPVGSAVAKVL